MLLVPLLALQPMWAQSTLGTILGTIKDASGAVVKDATVKVTNTDESTSRSVMTDEFGNYEALNTKPSHYSLEISMPGFQTKIVSGLQLIARQNLRVDVTLEVGTVGDAVTVEGTAGVITTDTAKIAASYDNQRMLNLPANFRASKDGNSPYNIIGSLPGVQSDNSNNFSIQGGIPSQSEASVDGISTTNVGGNAPLRNAFPSAEGIAEMRVEGVGNNAEYGQPGIITTISKGGSNDLHGSAFWYHQNRALDAVAYGQLTKPQKVANDFGFSASGPVRLPHLYDGKNKTFFFGDWENFRYPRQSTIQNRVPTQLLRDGNFSGEGITVKDPLTGVPFVNNTIPASRISQQAKDFMALFPLPNNGSTTTTQNANYIDNRSNNYNSLQWDVRGDHYISSTQSIFGRFTYKNIDQQSPNNLLIPSSTNVDHSRMMVVSHNWNVSPAVVNEARFGFTLYESGSTNSFDGKSLFTKLGLQGLGGTPFYNGVADVSIGDFTSVPGDRYDGVDKSRMFQFNDNLTWTKGRHTVKMGFDIRFIRAVSPLGFTSGDNYGQFNFDNTFTGYSFGDFLLGLPTSTAYSNVKQDNDGSTRHYNFYVQDSYRMSSKLTLEYGLRYEYHPSYTDASGNIGNFDPSVPLSGRVVYPTGKQDILAPGLLASFNACPGGTVNGAPCTPVLSASEAGLPESLRTVPKLRFMPRIGFAYRPIGDKTVFRGGFGVYNITMLGSIFYSLTGTLQSDVREFQNIDANGKPIFSWPQVKTTGSGINVGEYGSAYFGTANDINYKEPYSMQWNFSVDRELSPGMGLRASYIGMRTNGLNWSPNLNQSYYSTQFATSKPRQAFPFPNWGVVNTRSSGSIANYHSAQLEVTRKLRSGLTFDSSYTFAKNLAENGGPQPGGFAGENGGGRTQDARNRHAEYGDVYGTRRNRWITTALYDLPVGKGRQFGSHMNNFADAVVGGWRLSTILLFQSGPFLTPYFSGGDPSGTGSGTIEGRPQHPDRVGSGIPANQTRDHWLDASGFACPGQALTAAHPKCTIGLNPANDLAPIGRFGNSGIGVVTGPGTNNVSLSLSKIFSIGEKLKLKAEGSFTNALNHVNLADPELRIDNTNFGKITSARQSDFGGNRNGQVSLRLDF